MKKSILLISLSVVLLQGCALFDKHLFNPAASHARVDPLFRTAECSNYKAPDGGHWLSTLLSGSTRNMSSFIFKDNCEHQTRSLYDEDSLYKKICDPNSPKFSPSDCPNYLVSKSDEICEVHKSHIYGNRTAMNTLLATLGMGAGVAGTMTGANAAHYLAGSAGFITGGQAIMNKEVYRNFVTKAILLEIDTNRKKFLDSLTYINQPAGSGSQPGIGKIRQDALKYHNMCSFYDGLVSLMNKAGDKNDITSSKAVQQLTVKKATLEDEIKSLQAIVATLKADPSKAQELKVNENKLKDKKEELAALNVMLATVVVPAPTTP